MKYVIRALNEKIRELAEQRLSGAGGERCQGFSIGNLYISGIILRYS